MLPWLEALARHLGLLGAALPLLVRCPGHVSQVPKATLAARIVCQNGLLLLMLVHIRSVAI